MIEYDKSGKISCEYKKTGLKKIQLQNTLSSLCVIGDNYQNDLITTQVKSVKHMGDQIVKIEANCFRNCSNLTECSINKNITSIGEYAFSDCTHLTTVDIFNNVESSTNDAITIGKCAFKNTNLRNITLKTSATGVAEDDNLLSTFADCKNLESVTYVGKPVVGNYMYANCGNLRHVTFDNGFSYTATHAFLNCKSLEQITFPQKWLNGIGNNYFQGCINLTAVNMDDIDLDMTHSTYNFSIGSDIFSGCQNLLSVKLPPIIRGEMKQIDVNAFRGSNLLSVYCSNVIYEDMVNAVSFSQGFNVGHDCVFISKENRTYQYIYGKNPPNNINVVNYFIEDTTNDPMDIMSKSGEWYTNFTLAEQNARTRHIPVICYSSGGTSCTPCTLFKKLLFGIYSDAYEWLKTKNIILTYVVTPNGDGGNKSLSQTYKSAMNISLQYMNEANEQNNLDITGTTDINRHKMSVTYPVLAIMCKTLDGKTHYKENYLSYNNFNEPEQLQGMLNRVTSKSDLTEKQQAEELFKLFKQWVEDFENSLN